MGSIKGKDELGVEVGGNKVAKVALLELGKRLVQEEVRIEAELSIGACTSGDWSSA